MTIAKGERTNSGKQAVVVDRKPHVCNFQPDEQHQFQQNVRAGGQGRGRVRHEASGVLFGPRQDAADGLGFISHTNTRLTPEVGETKTFSG